MANEGEEIAMKQVQDYITIYSKEEAKNLITGFDMMSSPEFGNQIEKCDNKEGLSPKMTNAIDTVEGKYTDYFYTLLKTIPTSKLTNYLMQLGSQEEVKQ